MNPVQPLQDTLLVRLLKESATGSIIVPEENKKIKVGEVIASGKGLWDSTAIVPNEAKPGDKIYYAEYAEHRVNIEGEVLAFVRERDVFAIVRGGVKV